MKPQTTPSHLFFCPSPWCSPELPCIWAPSCDVLPSSQRSFPCRSTIPPFSRRPSVGRADHGFPMPHGCEDRIACECEQRLGNYESDAYLTSGGSDTSGASPSFSFWHHAPQSLHVFPVIIFRLYRKDTPYGVRTAAALALSC